MRQPLQPPPAGLVSARLMPSRGPGWGAANDNHPRKVADRELLHAALRHFSRHGLDSAAAAERLALRALRGGDRVGFAYFRAICAAFDRRRGERLAALAWGD